MLPSSVDLGPYICIIRTSVRERVKLLSSGKLGPSICIIRASVRKRVKLLSSGSEFGPERSEITGWDD